MPQRFAAQPEGLSYEVCLHTSGRSDVKATVGFYEMVTDQPAEWLAPVFADIVTPSATLAVGSVETVALFKEGSAEAASNRTAIIEFMVEDVDAEFARLKDKVEMVHEPKMAPWGNRSVHFETPKTRSPLCSCRLRMPRKSGSDRGRVRRKSIEYDLLCTSCGYGVRPNSAARQAIQGVQHP